MEFSWQYSGLMRNMATQSTWTELDGNVVSNINYYSLMLKVEFDEGNTWEVPTTCYSTIMRTSSNLRTLANSTVVYPLIIHDNNRECAGAETILKVLSRDSARLSKVRTPKGEVYYGANGIILDKDFTPLLLSTCILREEEVSASPQTTIPIRTQSDFTIYLHPKVFTDDEGIINKSLAKKGIAFYLSHSVDEWSNRNSKFTVKIEDPSRFIVRPEKPDVTHLSTKDFTEVLRDNIDEVLSQVVYDARRDR